MNLIKNDNKISNVPNLRFPEFCGNWATTTFGDLANYKKGPFGSALTKSLFVPKSKNSVKIYEQQNAINKDWKLERYYITTEYYQKMKSFTVGGGDIIVSCAGTIGEVYVLPEEAEIGIINQALMIIRIKNDINKNFYLSLFSNMIDNFSKKYSNGSAIKNIPPFSDLKNYEIKIPKLDEQSKIAVFLSLIDERIATQSKIIKDLETCKKGICNKIFDNPKWQTYIVSEIGSLGRGRVISTSEINKAEKHLYPVFSSQTSNNGIMGYLDTFEFEGEYITWTTDGANAGTVFYRNGKFNCTNVCGTIKLKKDFDAYFISYALQLATKKYVSINLANPKLMNNVMAEIKLKCPNIESQKYIATFLRSYDEKIETEKDILVAYKKQKAYLLSEMFI